MAYKWKTTRPLDHVCLCVQQAMRVFAWPSTSVNVSRLTLTPTLWIEFPEMLHFKWTIDHRTLLQQTHHYVSSGWLYWLLLPGPISNTQALIPPVLMWDCTLAMQSQGKYPQMKYNLCCHCGEKCASLVLQRAKHTCQPILRCDLCCCGVTLTISL